VIILDDSLCWQLKVTQCTFISVVLYTVNLITFTLMIMVMTMIPRAQQLVWICLW